MSCPFALPRRSEAMCRKSCATLLGFYASLVVFCHQTRLVQEKNVTTAAINNHGCAVNLKYVR